MLSEELKILVVDDNEEFCHNTTDILELEGHEVVSANNGFKALELVKQNGFALVLMDIRMPEMDGVETFKKMKELAPATPVILISVYPVEELVRQALREGAYGFIQKPLDFDEVIKIIDQATGQGAANTDGR